MYEMYEYFENLYSTRNGVVSQVILYRYISRFSVPTVWYGN